MRYPNAFPDDFETQILPCDIEFTARPVYRACLSGTINRAAFQSSLLDEHNAHRVFDLRKASTYSTSCFENPDAMRDLAAVFARRHPRMIIAQGVTDPDCGPHRRTPGDKRKHVDWWIYEEAEPQIHFSEVEL